MTHKTKISFSILILLIGYRLSGQSSELILTQEQNDVWFDSLISLTIDRKIDFIKTRVLHDTIVYNSNQLRSDRVILENVKKEQALKDKGYIADGRIMYFVRHKNFLFKKYKFVEFPWDNWTSTTEILKFCDFLSPDKIKSIEIITDKDNEMAIFGSMAGFGVIIFDLNKKKQINEFNKIKN
jgi:hypothetical protein